MFSKDTFTHRRLAAMREMELTDLLDVMAREGYWVTRMTFEQELVSNARVLLVATCARNCWSFGDA